MRDNVIKEKIKESKNISEDRFKEIPSIPKDMLIELGNICNHKCIFCANSKVTTKRGQISKEKIFDILKQGIDIGVKEVGFTAKGEPFLNKSILKFTIEAKRLGYEHIYVTTNGSLVNEEVVADLIESGINSIKFSINAGCKESYSKIHGKDDFQKVINNLTYLDNYRKKMKSDMKLSVSCILTNETKKEKQLLIDKVANYVDDLMFFDAHNQGGMMNENIEKGLIDCSEVAVKPCSEVFNRFNITYEGYVSACCVDYQNYLVIGDTNSMSLKEAWESDKFKYLRRKHINGDVEGCLCYNCIHKMNTVIEPLSKEFATIFDVNNFKK